MSHKKDKHFTVVSELTSNPPVQLKRHKDAQFIWKKVNWKI